KCPGFSARALVDSSYWIKLLGNRQPGGPALLLADVVLRILIYTHELTQLRVRHEAAVDDGIERFRIGLRIVDRDLDLEVAEVQPADALGELRRARQRAAAHVEPAVIHQPRRFDDERVAVPVADRVAVVPGIDVVFLRQRAAVEKDLAHRGARG